MGYLEFVVPPLQFDAVVDSSSKLGECLVMSFLAALGDSPSELGYGGGWSGRCVVVAAIWFSVACFDCDFVGCH